MPPRYLEELAAGFRAAGPLRRPEPTHGKPRRCPVCSASLIQENIRGITVDVCVPHGVWFDNGEVEQLEQRIVAGERLTTAQAVAEARREGKLSALWLGILSLFTDDD